jgi:hypothetical protein
VRSSALLVLTGCAALFGPTVLRWAEPPVTWRTEPTLPRRDACLLAPYALPSGETLMLNGFRVEPRGEGPRELTLTALGGAPIEPDLLLELLERRGDGFRAIDGVEQVGLSGCQVAGRPTPCLSLQLSLCAQPLDALTAALAEQVKRDPQARSYPLVFHLTLVGATGPRCEADDVRCRPEPYEAAPYRPDERRGLLAEPSSKERECSWDGECGRSACGGGCVPWTVMHRPGSCDPPQGAQDALCGCVDRHCAWFAQ